MANTPGTVQNRAPLWGPILIAFRAAIIFVSHMALAALVVVCVWAFSRLFHLLWGVEDPLLFDRVPLRYLFDAADTGVILVFAFYGVSSAAAAFRNQPP